MPVLNLRHVILGLLPLTAIMRVWAIVDVHADYVDFEERLAHDILMVCPAAALHVIAAVALFRRQEWVRWLPMWLGLLGAVSVAARVDVGALIGSFLLKPWLARVGRAGR